MRTVESRLRIYHNRSLDELPESPEDLEKLAKRLGCEATPDAADIRATNTVAVDWARVNRMKLERDLLLVPHAGTDRSEPMEDGGLVTKAGFDATAKAGDRVEGIDRALPPLAQREAARAWLMDTLPSEKRGWLK